MDRTKLIDNAIERVKKDFDYTCIICDTYKPKPLYGCHVFDRGIKKYSTMAHWLSNIFPMCDKHHREMDFGKSFYKKKPWQKMRWLYKTTHIDWKGKVFQQLIDLSNMIRYGDTR